MAAAIKALNAKIRANPVLDYVCSTREFSYNSFPAYTARISTHSKTSRAAPTSRLQSCDEERRTELTRLMIDFLGPVSNFGIPIAAVLDTQKSPELCVALLPLLVS